MAAKNLAWRLGRYIGEMASAIRTGIGSVMGVSTGSDFSLDSSVVDYKLSRQLYYNTHDKYKLGAGFAKPIIDTVVGFMGAPHFVSSDPEAQKVLDENFNAWTGKFIKLQRNWLRDGDVYVILVNVVEEDGPSKILYKDQDRRFEMRFFPPERVNVISDPHNTDKLLQVEIKTEVAYKNTLTNEDVRYTALEIWTNENHYIKYDGQLPEGLTNIEEANPYKFIPIWWFRNENEEHQLHGQSELEPVEPYMRAYHDVMMHALKTSKLTAAPKLRIKSTDMDGFLKANFTDEEIRNKTLKLGEKDAIFLTDKDDDAGYVQVSATNHSTLLEFLFMCIVDVSETPEFAFGTAVASSMASVSEQMVPLAKKVLRKRAQIEDDYRVLCRMLFALSDMVAGGDVGVINDYEVTIEWDEIDKQDDTAAATIVKTLVDAMVSAVGANLMSYEAAINFLARYIDTMKEFATPEGEKAPGEKDRILAQRKELAVSDSFMLMTAGANQLDQVAQNINPQPAQPVPEE